MLRWLRVVNVCDIVVAGDVDVVRDALDVDDVDDKAASNLEPVLRKLVNT